MDCEAPVCTIGFGAVVGVCCGVVIGGSTAEPVGELEAPPVGVELPSGSVDPLDPPDPLLPLDPLPELLELDDFAFVTVSDFVFFASTTPSWSAVAWAVTTTVPLFTFDGMATVIATCRAAVSFLTV
jgi:ABC-type lipoprotein release transport system permease subunit